MQDQIRELPKYSVSIRQISCSNTSVSVQVKVVLENPNDIKSKMTVDPNSVMYFLVGDNLNNVVLLEKYK